MIKNLTDSIVGSVQAMDAGEVQKRRDAYGLLVVGMFGVFLLLGLLFFYLAAQLGMVAILLATVVFVTSTSFTALILISYGAALKNWKPAENA